jgi:hypothetical protein
MNTNRATAVLFSALALLSIVNEPALAQFTLLNVGHANDGNVAYHVVVSGNYAYLAYDGLRIYDISDPANPTAVCFTNNGGSANEVVVAGNYVYLANSTDGLRIYDLANPTNAINVGHANDHANNAPFYFGADAVAVAGNYAYVANTGDGLRIYDVSDRAQPTGIGHTNNGGVASGVVVVGNHVFLANYLDGFRIYDVSDPTNPINVGYATNSRASKVAVAGNYAYVANNNSGPDADVLSVYDISDLTNPLSIGHATIPFAGGLVPHGRGVAVSGKYVYLATEYGGLHLYDVSNPAIPKHVGSANDGGAAWASAAIGNYAYVANFTDGLRSYLLLPALSIEITNTNAVILSWPVPPSTNFVLQQNSDLRTANWITLTNLPTVASNRNQLSLSTFLVSQFFRISIW